MSITQHHVPLCINNCRKTNSPQRWALQWVLTFGAQLLCRTVRHSAQTPAGPKDISSASPSLALHKQKVPWGGCG